jgi:hypothetical protein
MTRALRRVFCRWFHGGRFLRRSLVGWGALTCSACGSGFVDLADAGMLDDARLKVWPRTLPGEAEQEKRRPEFVSTALIVRQGAQIREVKVA